MMIDSSLPSFSSAAVQQRQQVTRKTLLLLPFFLASLLVSLAATFHSTQIYRLFYESTRELTQPEEPRISKPSRARNDLAKQPAYSRNRFTFDSFRVAGVELASYGLGDIHEHEEGLSNNKEEPFELFEDFDLSSKLIGDETWVDLIGYRRDESFPSLSFYVDKIARKRWLPSTGMDGLNPYVLKYGEELLGGVGNGTSREEEQKNALLQLLPVGTDYAAKPTHLSCAGGVWLTKTVGNTTLVGNGKKPMKEAPHDFSTSIIATDLAQQLQKVQKSCGRRVNESLALQNVKPGIVVEELFDSFDGTDYTGGTEFKVFTIWGRMWIAVQRPGMDGAVAILHRNGTNLDWDGRSDPLPDWIDWSRIVEIAEQSGAHKDMFRTDIFVGIPSSSSSPDGGTKAVRYVVSENEIHPTEYFHVSGTQPVFDEGGRLWLAGYAKGNYRVVPNTEVPRSFVEHGMLPELDSNN